MAVENINTSEIISGLNLMNQQINNVYSSLSLDGDDARACRLKGLNTIVSGHMILFQSVGHGRTPDQARAAIYATKYPNPEGAVHAVTRLGLITLFFFEIDALFQDLLHALGKPVKFSFSRNARQLVGATNVTSSTTSLEILKVGVSIRNSLHAGGIHIHPTFSKIMQGTNFEFVEGQVCECSGWRDVLIACKEALIVVEEILRTPEVLAIPFMNQHRLKIPL